MRTLLTGLFFLLLADTGAAAQLQRWTANDGQIVMEDIPAIPESLPPILSRYQNIRSAGFSSWSNDSKSIYIKTRLGPVAQLHRVKKPGGARYQVTFGEEPVGEIRPQPNSSLLALTLDEGGDEFTRKALWIECARSLTSNDVIRVLGQLVELHGMPTAIKSDNVLSPESTLNLTQYSPLAITS